MAKPVQQHERPLPSTLGEAGKIKQNLHVLEKDVRHLVEALGQVFKSALDELLGHGYGHTDVHAVNLMSLGLLVCCGYWGFVAGDTPLHNLPLAWKVLSWAQLAHLRLTLMVYNPTNWLSTSAYQLWMTCGALLLLQTLSQCIEFAYVAKCLTDPATQSLSCPYSTEPNLEHLSCDALPPIASLCPSHRRSSMRFMVAFGSIQLCAYLGCVLFEFTKVQAVRTHMIDNIIRAQRSAHTFHRDATSSQDTDDQDDGSGDQRRPDRGPVRSVVYPQVPYVRAPPSAASRGMAVPP